MTPPTPEIRSIAAQRAAVERAVTDADGIASVVDRAFPALFARLAEHGVAPAGAPYIRYHRHDEVLELELGVPVPDGVEADAGLPGGRTAILRHVGPFDGLRAACDRLIEWVAERGETASGPLWEVYVTNPREEPDSSKWITDIHIPLR
jgi:hypothetical protein